MLFCVSVDASYEGQRARIYRENVVFENLGWVNYDFGNSTVCMSKNAKNHNSLRGHPYMTSALRGVAEGGLAQKKM